MKQSRGPSATEPGFALIVVLWVVALVSIVALSLAVAIRAEIDTSIAGRDSLRAELLAESGLAIADFLEIRTPDVEARDLAELTGVPVTVAPGGRRYRFTLPEGTIDLFLEGEDGKINLSTASDELIANFFTLWTDDTTRGAEIAAAISDWRDTDSQLSLFGAETLAYQNSGYLPRNDELGMADTLLIRGLGREDQQRRVVPDSGRFRVREGLHAFVTTGPSGPLVDPNIAPKLVLMSVPGIDEQDADRIVEARRTGLGVDPDRIDLLLSGSGTEARDYMNFGPPQAPAILAVGQTGTARRSIRRVYSYELEYDLILGLFLNTLRLNHIERDVVPEFVQP